jgi:hypothetical protein
MATPLTDAQEIHQRISELQAELDKASPGIATHLLRIHKDLAASPELLHILSEDEIAIIAKGLQVQSQVQIVAPKAKAPKREKLADLEI